jgi:uncharacterized protein (UPF0305 family)
MDVTWFLDMFVDLNSRARIFAILLSAVLAFIGIKYTQSKALERERLSYLRSKFEEMILDINLILEKKCSLNVYTILSEEELDKKIGRYNKDFDFLDNLTKKVDMLISVYAPFIKINGEAPESDVSCITFQGHFDLRDMKEHNSMVLPPNEPDDSDLMQAIDLWNEGDLELKRIQQILIKKCRKIS